MKYKKRIMYERKTKKGKVVAYKQGDYYFIDVTNKKEKYTIPCGMIVWSLIKDFRSVQEGLK